MWANKKNAYRTNDRRRATRSYIGGLDKRVLLFYACVKFF
nr:MAG TPA: hypothetical protein [Caudoviricetes sp.]DAH50687.1 MAG TPA: hypothetical protein [Caudoviricetes sp.]